MAVQTKMNDLKQFSPTTSLPILSRLAQYSTREISSALENIQNLYFPPIRSTQPTTRFLPKHILHDTSVPDSGYASSEDDDEDYNYHRPYKVVFDRDDEEEEEEERNGNTFDIDVIRSDTFEREFCIRWLTSFTARSDSWVSYFPSSSSPCCDENVIPNGEDNNDNNPETETDTEQDIRSDLINRAATLLSSFAGEGSSETDHSPLIRKFSFPILGCTNEPDTVKVELGDAPLLNEDHTSVGLQSWASSIVLAEKICSDPLLFGFPPLPGDCEGTKTKRRRGLRVLELGAGTGLLSIVAAKLLLSTRASGGDDLYSTTEIVATDYHPSVLDNLQTNISTNFPSLSSTALSPPTIVQVVPLDWEQPNYTCPPLNTCFDIILAADVIYHSNHASWIKGCVETLLKRVKGEGDVGDGGGGGRGGVFWLIIPVRSVGRHEGMGCTVEAVFPFASSLLEKRHNQGGEVLAIRRKEELGRKEGVGRADESSYVLYEIGWVGVD